MKFSLYNILGLKIFHIVNVLQKDFNMKFYNIVFLHYYFWPVSFENEKIS